MIKVDISFTDNLSPVLKQYRKDLKELPKEALKEFKSLTPIRTGNARNNTTLRQSPSGSTIDADYPYAERLDEGWSNQAPKGMTAPFDKWFEKQIKRIFGK